MWPFISTRSSYQVLGVNDRRWREEKDRERQGGIYVMTALKKHPESTPVKV